MAATVEIRDLGDLVKQLTSRVATLEQRTTTGSLTAMPSDPVFHTVTVDVSLLATASNPATSLSGAPGIFLDSIFIDVAWTASATANEYQVEVAQKIAGVYQAPTQYRTAGTNLRVDGLLPNTTYGIRVYAINRLGLSSLALPSSGFQDYTTGHDTTTPSAITGFTVTAGFRSMVVVWNDTTDFDFDSYQLEIATNSGFTTGVRDTYVRGSIGGFDDLVANTIYWVRARTYDTSGNAGPWTSGASITTQQLGSSGSSGEIVPSYIDSVDIHTAAIITAKIATLAVTDATIFSASVTKLTTGTFTTSDFILGSGGQIKTASLAPGFVINASGVSFYDSSGTRTIFLDSSTGSGTFKGSIAAGSTITGTVITGSTIIGGLIETASSGPRVEIGNGYISAVSFFAGLPGELSVAALGTGVNSKAAGVGGVGTGLYLSSGFDIAHGSSDAYLELFGPSSLYAAGIIQMGAQEIDLSVGGSSGIIRLSGDTIEIPALGPGVGEIKGTVLGSPGYYGSAPALLGHAGHAHTFDWTGSSYTFYVDGTDVSSSVKSFVIPHPLQEARYLVYGCLEGPEAGIYCRGRAELVGGELEVRIPDHFLAIAEDFDVWVNPISQQNKDYWNTAVEKGRFIVYGPRGGGRKFSWLVMATRKDIVPLEVEPLRSAVKVSGDGPYTYIS